MSLFTFLFIVSLWLWNLSFFAQVLSFHLLFCSLVVRTILEAAKTELIFIKRLLKVNQTFIPTFIKEACFRKGPWSLILILAKLLIKTDLIVNFLQIVSIIQRVSVFTMQCRKFLQTIIANVYTHGLIIHETESRVLIDLFCFVKWNVFLFWGFFCSQVYKTSGGPYLCRPLNPPPVFICNCKNSSTQKISLTAWLGCLTWLLGKKSFVFASLEQSTPLIAGANPIKRKDICKLHYSSFEIYFFICPHLATIIFCSI